MKRVLFMLVLAGGFVTALTGCRVEGEVDDMSNVTAPR